VVIRSRKRAAHRAGHPSLKLRNRKRRDSDKGEEKGCDKDLFFKGKKKID